MSSLKYKRLSSRLRPLMHVPQLAPAAAGAPVHEHMGMSARVGDSEERECDVVLSIYCTYLVTMHFHLRGNTASSS